MTNASLRISLSYYVVVPFIVIFAVDGPIVVNPIVVVAVVIPVIIILIVVVVIIIVETREDSVWVTHITSFMIY